MKDLVYSLRIGKGESKLRLEIRIAGYGGQGIIRAGRILAMTASLYEGKYAVMTQSYGPESRGGHCKSDVVIADEEIDYPMVSNPDFLIAMSQEGYDLNIHLVKKEGVVILDSTLVKRVASAGKPRIYSVPAVKIAEEIGNKIISNIVMLGFLSGVSGIVSLKSLEKAIKDTFPKKFLEFNMKALKEGHKRGNKERIT